MYSLNKFIFLIILIFLSFLKTYGQYSKKYPIAVEQAISKAGKNGNELIKVLEYYQRKKEDSLKLKSAVYLISNMPFHNVRDDYKNFNDLTNFLYNQRIEQSEEGINEEKIRDYTRKAFEEHSKVIFNKKNNYKPFLERDIDLISSKELIENIELAFKAYYKLPLKYRSNFDDFIHYCLPYRSSGEPVLLSKRRDFFEKYNWVYDSLKIKPLDKVIEIIYNDLRLDGGQRLLRFLDGSLSLEQIEKLKFGRCDDIVNYFVMLFRSLGFCAGKDYITHWGNFYHSSGHSWVFIKVKDKNYPIQVSVDNYSNSTSLKIFKVGSMPKIYRHEYVKVIPISLDTLPKNDVTGLYRPNSNLNIENIFAQNSNKNFKLCVFDNKKQWEIVDENYQYNQNIVSFKNVGMGILYSICVAEKNSLKLINYPFYLNFNGDLTFLDNSHILNETTLTRKYPPFFPHINVKTERIKTLNECSIQASNSLEKDSFVEIFKIKNFSSTHKVKYLFSNKEKFRYYRLFSENNTTIHLAYFNFIDESGQRFKYLDPAYNGLETSDRLFRILDDDPLSYIEYKNLNIIFDIPSNKSVTGFEIQARNDDNHINVGEKYELLQFDKKWESLGIEIARDTVLKYKNLPKNGLYLLKNLTKGKEENIFTLDNNGNQFWFGVTDIQVLLNNTN